MKQILLSLLFLSATTMGCIDPPTPVKLTNTTIENESISITPEGINFSNSMMQYDAEKKKWCFRAVGEVKSTCDSDTTILKLSIRDDRTNEILAIATVDNDKKKITLKPVKRPLSKEVKEVEVDEESAFLVFSDNSDDRYSRFNVTAYEPNERGKLKKLGSATAARDRFSKGIGPDARKNVADLRNQNIAIAGCGETKSEESRKKSEFKVGNNSH